MPLNIIIIGAGLGGLCAAFALARSGHTVTLYERRPTFIPAGGGIMIRPNATRFLIQWGLESDFTAISDPAGATNFRDGKNGELLMKRQVMTKEAGGWPDWGTFRRETQEILFRRAEEVGVRMVFGVGVEDVWEDLEKGKAGVRLSGGKGVREADLVLVADGVLSRLRGKVLPDAPEPKLGWSTLYQTMVDGRAMRRCADAERLVGSSDLEVWMMGGGGGYIVSRYNSKLDVYGGVYGIPETDENPRLYDEHGDLEMVQQHFEGYDAAIRSSLGLAKSCDRWRLTEMPDLAQWVSNGGRLVLLGDSAHAMFPSAAQGFSQIVEDVAALSYLLAEKSSLGIPRLTKAWQEVRIPRVNRIKAWAHANEMLYSKGIGGGSSPKTSRPAPDEKMSLADEQADRDAPFRSGAFVRWAFGYDAVAEVKKHVEQQYGTDATAKL